MRGRERLVSGCSPVLIEVDDAALGVVVHVELAPLYLAHETVLALFLVHPLSDEESGPAAVPPEEKAGGRGRNGVFAEGSDEWCFRMEILRHGLARLVVKCFGDVLWAGLVGMTCAGGDAEGLRIDDNGDVDEFLGREPYPEGRIGLAELVGR